MARTVTLEDQLSYFERLDASRVAFARWRDEGRAALTHFLLHRGTSATREWDDSLSLTTRALVITALSRYTPAKAAVLEEVKTLASTQLPDLLGRGASSILYARDGGGVTFLDAARGLMALSSAPTGAFARATMYFYYAVIRELYFASDPGWAVGGARGGTGGLPSAFATAHLVEGVTSFKRMLQRTGAYVDAVASLLDRPITAISGWNEVDMQRWNIAARTRMEQSASNLAFPIESPTPARSGDAQSDFDTFLSQNLTRIPEGLDLAVEMFDAAVSEIRRFRDEETRAATRPYMHRLTALSEGAHEVALGAVSDAATRARDARELFRHFRDVSLADVQSGGDVIRQYAAALRNLKQAFDAAACGSAKLLHPTIRYVSAVLDHELAAVGTGGSAVAFEPAEMAAAAAALGAASDMWTDERLARAAEVLSGAVTEKAFPIGRPFHTGAGTYYQPTQPSILMYYGYLLQHAVRAGVSDEGMRRIESYFTSTKEVLDSTRSAWRWEFGEVQKRSAFHTAISTLALTRLNRMLDARINDSVLEHFVSKRVEGPKLDQLFYPDYGLAAAAPKDRPSVAVVLERMHAHIAGVDLGQDRVYSLVLHGPPGTGKTTLVEALAASTGTRLVEVTPSDIVIRGADRVEERARAVLRALALLTRVVILFDEFDSVLRSRIPSTVATDNATPQGPSIFDFLSGGMLPKLKQLYESARRRRVAYVLATNFLSALDTAAIREGRFDKTLGIYPPDVLSRAGRLWNMLSEFARQQRRTFAADDTFVDDVKTVLELTKDASMPLLTRPGWFVGPPEVIPQDTPLAFLTGSDTKAPPTVQRTEKERSESSKVMTDEERKEYEQIETWERSWVSSENQFAEDILTAFRRGIPPPEKKQSG